jgi:hypothetical protein
VGHVKPDKHGLGEAGPRIARIGGRCPRRKTPDITIAYSFLLENPECFVLDENCEDQEWPADMPQVPPMELIAAYYEAESALDLC